MADLHPHLFSVLALQRFALRGGFLQKFPHAWIVWEPVVWKPSPLNSVTAQTLPVSFSTRPPERPDGDALCFELASDEPVKLGRAPDCDLHINDAAVSREHLWLEQDGGGWRVRPASPGARSLLNGAPLPAEGASILPGAELRLGGVVLRFEDAASMDRRLQPAAT